MYDTPFVTESVLTPEGYNEPGQLAGKAAQLFMKMLWLSRLSRPDIAFAISSLASNISKWTRNHDLMLYRLLATSRPQLILGYMELSLQMRKYQGCICSQTRTSQVT